MLAKSYQKVNYVKILQSYFRVQKSINRFATLITKTIRIILFLYYEY
jgi:hypothetical protein